MRVLSWNVQGAVPPNGNKERIRNQIEFIEQNADTPDILMLNEVTTVQEGFWRRLLQSIGYGAIVDTLDWASDLRKSSVPPHHQINHVNGNLIALRDSFEGDGLKVNRPSIQSGPWEDAVLKDWSTNFPEKILNAEFVLKGTRIELWNIRAVPGSLWGEEKIKILENTYNRIRKGGTRPSILAGDLNSPKAELEDGTVVPWGLDRGEYIRDRWITAELNFWDGLREIDMVDVFREVHGYGELDERDVSFKTRRFDHIFASDIFNPTQCSYDPGGLECSDHAPLIATLEL